MLRGRHVAIGALSALALILAACGQVNEDKATDAESPAAVEESPGTTATTDPQAEFCAEVGRRVSVRDCEDLTRLADEAARGTAAFNAPNPMQRGEVHTLQLAISTTPPEPPAPAAAEEVDQAQPRPEDQLQPSCDPVTHACDPSAPVSSATPEDVVDPLQGETETFSPLVGRFMRAELVGNGFDITPLSEASQEVLPDSVTTWTWRVEAREGGHRALTLRTVVEGCTESGQCYPLRSTSQNYDVTVEVGFMGKAQDFLTTAPTWLRLLAGVLAALAVLVSAWFGLRGALRKGRAS